MAQNAYSYTIVTVYARVSHSSSPSFVACNLSLCSWPRLLELKVLLPKVSIVKLPTHSFSCYRFTAKEPSADTGVMQTVRVAKVRKFPKHHYLVLGIIIAYRVYLTSFDSL